MAEDHFRRRQIAYSCEKRIPGSPDRCHEARFLSRTYAETCQLVGFKTPKAPKLFTSLGGFQKSLRLSQKRFGEAEKLFEQALERDPNSAEALGGLATAYVQQKQPARALARVNAQIARAPENGTYYVLLAELLISEKQLEKAEAALPRR